jgi:hypothetical protein
VRSRGQPGQRADEGALQPGEGRPAGVRGQEAGPEALMVIVVGQRAVEVREQVK